MTNGLDPDQARHFVGPDLALNCLQTLTADDTSRQIVHSYFQFYICGMSNKRTSDGSIGHLVGPDLAPNCFQTLTADDTSPQIVHSYFHFYVCGMSNKPTSDGSIGYLVI